MKETINTATRIAVVGAGNVGATYAYALLLSGLAAEIVLIDANQARAEGEAMDLNHTAPLVHPARIWAGTYADCAGAAITVITAGAGQKPGETRLDLLKRNADIFKPVVAEITRYNPDGILLIATNPVDILTQISLKISGLPAGRVIGSGTILDTARFRYLLSSYFNVDSRSVHAYIIGEHGDSEVPVWSLANIGGMRLADYCQANHLNCVDRDLEDIFEQTRSAAYHIIERKGATYYAIASGLVRISEAMLRDQSTVLCVSSQLEDYLGISGVCLSVPAVVNRSGVERTIRLDLAPGELDGLRKSAAVLQETYASLDLPA